MASKKISLTKPKYQQIAVDVAEKIAEGKLHVGDKIHARSTLANQYQVSPETARKAIIVLVDLEIVKAKHGSGFYVASKEKAQDFVTQYQDVQTIAEIKEELLDSVAKQKEELTHFSSILDTLVEQTKRFDSFDPMSPCSFVLTEEAEYLGQNTSSTFIAIKHNEERLVSPGPYAKISLNDTLYFVGHDESTLQRVQNFFYP